MGSGSADTVAAAHAPSSPLVTPSGAAGVPVVLRFGDHAVAATLADTAPSKELAAMLPLTLELSDAWSQAKSGRLPPPLLVADAGRVLKPTQQASTTGLTRQH
jgi:hypothetical protein